MRMFRENFGKRDLGPEKCFRLQTNLTQNWQFHTNLTQKKIFFTHSHTFSHKSSGFSHILTHSHTKFLDSHTKVLDSHTKALKSLCWGKKKGTFGWGNFLFWQNAAGVIFKKEHQKSIFFLGRFPINFSRHAFVVFRAIWQGSRQHFLAFNTFSVTIGKFSGILRLFFNL